MPELALAAASIQDAGDNIGSERLLRIGEGGDPYLKGLPQVHQIAHDRSRADIDGRAVAYQPGPSGGRYLCLQLAPPPPSTREYSAATPGYRFGDQHAAIAGRIGLAGQPPPILQLSSGDEELVLRCGRGGALQETDTALSARPPAAALRVNRQARLSHRVKEGNAGFGLDLQAEAVKSDACAFQRLGVRHLRGA